MWDCVSPSLETTGVISTNFKFRGENRVKCLTAIQNKVLQLQDLCAEDKFFSADCYFWGRHD